MLARLTSIIGTLFIACQTPQVEMPLSMLVDQPVVDATDAEQFWSPNQRQIGAIYHYLVGEYSILSGELRASHEAFAKAYSLDPDPFLGGKSVLTMAELGDLDRALTESRKMVLLHPKDAYLRFLFGQLLVRTGQLSAAQQQLERALVIDRFHLASYHALVDLHVLSKQFTQALQVNKQMVQQLPGAVFGWSKLSRIYLLLDQKQQALAPARTAYEMQSSNPAMILIYAYILELNGKSQQAIALYEKLYRENAANEHFIGHLAELYRQLGNLEQALGLLGELADRQTSVGVNIQRVVILWELKRNQQAKEILLTTLEQHPQDQRLLYLTALADERLANYRQAIERYQQVQKDDKLQILARFRTAICYQQLKQLDDAIVIMQQLVKLAKPRWQFFAFLAELHGKQQNNREALRVIRTGLNQHHQMVRLLFLRGVYQEKTSDVEGCIKTMREVIDLDPMHSGALNYLGYLLAEQNRDLSEALTLVQRALRLQPDNGYYLDSLAWVYYRLGNYQQAHIYIVKALEKYPEEAVILEHYADILIKLNRKQLAIDNYRKAQLLFDKPQDRQRVESKINNYRRLPPRTSN